MAVGASSALSGLRILVVDDEMLVADYIEALLEDLGCLAVGPVPTVEKALAVVAGQPLDGVLLDANLNGHSSVAIAAELRSRGLPFIVVTGYGQLVLPDAALNEAPRLTKPFDGAEFEKMLKATFVR